MHTNRCEKVISSRTIFTYLIRSVTPGWSCGPYKPCPWFLAKRCEAGGREPPFSVKQVM